MSVPTLFIVGEGLVYVLFAHAYGLVGLVAGIVLMTIAGRVLLELAELFGLTQRVAVCRLPADSPFGPGGYRFGDFLRAGIPLQIVVLIVSALLIQVLAA